MWLLGASCGHGWWWDVQLTETMEKFEKGFEDLDIQSAVMENAIQSSTGMSTPEDQVNMLLQKVPRAPSWRQK